MDEYLKKTNDFTPEDISATGTIMNDNIVKVIESIPQQTGLVDNLTIEEDFSIPKYLVQKKIEVKRYILKK